MRVLFADDQIPDDEIPDKDLYETIKKKYQTTDEDVRFIEAFKVMRRAKRAVSEDNKVTVARRFKDALSLVRNQDFDVAIIDLGWYADDSISETIERSQAGWVIADALDEADQQHPERSPTAQIIYSARFNSSPGLGEIAANKGRLPFLKPYEEQATISLKSRERTKEREDREAAACQSLRATLSFIGHLRASAASSQVNRSLDLLLNEAEQGVKRAAKRESRWDFLTLILVSASIAIVLTGVIGLFFFGVPQGAVTAAVGIVVGLIPKLMYGELRETRKQIQTATENLTALVEQARTLTGDSPAQ